MPPTDSLVQVEAPVVGVHLGWRSWLVIGATSLLGFFAIAWPLLVPPGLVADGSRAASAPYLFALLLPAVLLLAVSQVSEGGLDSKALAMLGVLSAINAAVRPVLGAGTAGIESVFFLIILAGRAFGAGFGFMLGMSSLFASALLTAGVGPWLPFQMLAAGWVGLGAGLLPRRLRGPGEITVLIGYGILSAYLFGMLMNLWFWPFLSGGEVPGYPGATGSLDFVPGAPVLDNLARFGWFTLVTSTGGWDTGRAITTSLAILVLGRPLLLVLRRASGLGRTAV